MNQDAAVEWDAFGDNDELFRLIFRAKKKGQLQDWLAATSEFTKAEAYSKVEKDAGWDVVLNFASNSNSTALCHCPYKRR